MTPDSLLARGGFGGASPRLYRRLERLQHELEDAGAGLPELTETGLLREIDRARFPRRHERRFPSYGAIVCASNIDQTMQALDDLGAIRLIGTADSASDVRQMADGVQSFAFVRHDAAELVLLPSPVPREVELVRFRRALGPDATVVCRLENGSVRVHEEGRIVIFDGTRWWVKLGARDYTALVCHAVPNASVDITEQILDFCVHCAGPPPGGTILVWCLDDESVGMLKGSSDQTRAPLPLRLSLTVPVAHSSIRHLLSQVDGAAAVNRVGEVTEVGLHLRPSAEADSVVGTLGSGGTRHAAAQRCSYDITGAVFFVVSDDGPVSVYYRGRVVASIDM